MKLTLVDNMIMPAGGSLAMLDVHPHLGLLALAAVTEAAGRQVQIVDPKRLVRDGRLALDESLYSRAADLLLATRPDAVGFTALGCSFLFAIRVAAELKRRASGLPILLGGPHATMLHREILESFPQFDIIVRHEADETFPAVLEQLEERRFEAIPGISWRAASGSSDLQTTVGKPKVENLDALPMGRYDHYPIEELGLDLLRIEAGRGCPFLCTFCSTAGFFQRSFRLKSAARLLHELDVLHERYGCSHFKLDHDMFTVNRRKVLEFCEAVRDRRYRWRASARVDCVDAEMLERMADAGCAGLYFGIETGSARMQKICHKRLDLALVHPILEACEGLGIETTASFITGFPQETGDDLDATLDMLGECMSPACLAQLHMLAPEPGTPLFAEHGGRIEYDGYGSRYNAQLLSREDERVVLGHPAIFQTYYFYPPMGCQSSRARGIFAVETADLLRRVGPLVVRCLLLAYEGRLSRLVEAYRKFAGGDAAGMPDAHSFEAFVAAEFGVAHHLTSIIRYALAVSAASSARTLAVGDMPFDPAAPYHLNPEAQILPDIHDCERVMSFLERADAEQDCTELGQTGTHIIVKDLDAVKTYFLDSAGQAVLSMFEVTHTCGEVNAMIRAAAECEMDMEFFDGLVRNRILVPNESRARPF